MIKFVTGNLLDAKVDALVNTVNTAGVMGKGLALQFKKAFPANCKSYEAAAKAHEVWRDVRPLIGRGLADLPDVEVLVFEPNGAPAPEEMRDETAKPKTLPRTRRHS
jgi:O-acetyl-ADP-ribose deacetylase (regulator of RNase III)